MKNENIKKMVISAILSALSVILYIFFKVNVPTIFPSFLEFNLSMLPILITTLALGYVWGIQVVIIRFLAKIVIMGTSTAYVGEIADLILGLSVVIIVGLSYKSFFKNNKNKDIISLSLGIAEWVIVASLINYFILAPFYIKLFFKDNVEAFINAISVIDGLNESNYLIKYIIFAVIPFNFILSLIVSFITLLVNKRISFIYRIEE